MDADRFWSLMESADSPSALHAVLSALSGEELLAFERFHAGFMDRPYHWSLWGAAYVIDGGCSDDTFEYFRAYLISRGREVFEGALADPDSLADVPLDSEDEWEDWMSPTMFVIHARTGRYAFVGPPDPHGARRSEPDGEPWEEADLPGRFPRLAQRYGLWSSPWVIRAPLDPQGVLWAAHLLRRLPIVFEPVPISRSSS